MPEGSMEVVVCMKKVIRLFSIQIWALLGDMLSIGSGRRKKPKLLYAAIILFVISMSSLAFLYCYAIGKVLLQYDSIAILPPMVMAATSVIVLMTTIFKIKGTVFGFRDYDLIMSMPVSTGSIVASRILLLYGINFVFVLMLIVPMMAAYGILASPDIIFYLTGTLSLFFVPLVPIVLASVLGTLITLVAVRFRRSNLVSILASTAVLASIIALSFMIGDSGEEMANISMVLTRKVNDTYPLADLYTRAVCNGDIVALAGFLLISLGAFFLFSYIVGKLFRKLNSAAMAGSYHRDFKLAGVKTSTPLKALFLKEMKRYFSSTIYVLNTGIGIVLLTIGTIALFFVDMEKLLGGQLPAGMLSQGGPLFLSFCLVTSCTTMASISLEGRNLWIVKSLPVPARIIFGSKLLVNLVVTAPAVLDAILIAFAMKMNFTEGLIMVLVSLVIALFVSLFGLILNLRLPNFNWTSETIVVKQSAATMITLFGGFAVVGVQVLLLAAIKAFVPAYLIYLGIMSVVVLLLYRILMSYGVKRFHEL